MCRECLPEGLRRRCRPVPSSLSEGRCGAPPTLSHSLVTDRDARAQNQKEGSPSSTQSLAVIGPATAEEIETSESDQYRPHQHAQTSSVVEAVAPAPLTDEQLLVRFNEATRLPNFEKLVVQRLLKRALWLLRACSYPVNDICAILAHASVYYRDTIVASGRQMEPLDMAHVLVALIYLAHCHIEDNTCPLNVWHRHLCKDYCSLNMFNSAVLKLMSMRKWVLRVDQTELALRMQLLVGQENGNPAEADFAMSFWAGGSSPAQASSLAMSFWAENGRKASAVAVPAHLVSPASTSSCAGTSLYSPTSTAASAESLGSSSASAISTDDEQQCTLLTP